MFLVNKMHIIHNESQYSYYRRPIQNRTQKVGDECLSRKSQLKDIQATSSFPYCGNYTRPCVPLNGLLWQGTLVTLVCGLHTNVAWFELYSFNRSWRTEESFVWKVTACYGVSGAGRTCTSWYEGSVSSSEEWPLVCEAQPLFSLSQYLDKQLFHQKAQTKYNTYVSRWLRYSQCLTAKKSFSMF